MLPCDRQCPTAAQWTCDVHVMPYVCRYTIKRMSRIESHWRRIKCWPPFKAVCLVLSLLLRVHQSASIILLMLRSHARISPLA